jgi:hypothetical protein
MVAKGERQDSFVYNRDMKPGEDLIRQGIQDLEVGRESIEALLVSIGAPRLRSVGLTIPADTFPTPEHRLYRKLASQDITL